jgi:bifunctional DNA-binding transcriptional regulator/antitoxin component of YhaV-PrlF toxin-antitoxin module
MSRLSAKHQITIPVSVLKDAGLAPGDELRVRAAGPGRLEVERVDDLIARWAGALPAGTFPEGYIDRQRDEWER